ncbi:MAG: TIGR00730 family Rossman fold protein [Bacteroidetes bacterium]|nr:MAG: TIGR00730 family Rossman fold protein [Bacteroidota bacterium]
MKSICVFCGSSMGANPVYRQAAGRFGQLLGEKGYRLIFGGSNIGLMLTVADETMKFGGEAVGVMPHLLKEKEIAHEGLTDLHLVESMAERKALMERLSDAFVALPGGYGTLDELAEVLTWQQLNLMEKPVAILNVNGFFDPLIAWFDHAVHEGFIRGEHRDNLIVVDSPEALLERLASFSLRKAPEKWVDTLRMESGHDLSPQ